MQIHQNVNFRVRVVCEALKHRFDLSSMTNYTEKNIKLLSSLLIFVPNAPHLLVRADVVQSYPSFSILFNRHHKGDCEHVANGENGAGAGIDQGEAATIQ